MDLSGEGFHKIRDLINDRSGIWLGEAKNTFLQVRLAPRLKITNSETLKDYYYYLKYDSNGESELEALIDSVTVSETSFFRHQEQLEDFCSVSVPELVRRKEWTDPLTIWSAGCSTGEEAYTLAMLLMENPCGMPLGSINIMASDISPSSLQSAREGIYDDHSLRHAPRDYLVKYFEKKSSGKYAIQGQVKRLVKFGGINLTDSRATGRLRNVDCIFCRNVIIYFDDRHKVKCIENLYQSLRSGGYLFLGYSESLGRLSNLFEAVKLKKTVVYRKPDEASL
jgi:chemotaxis protein methyltransferase CheR